MKKSILFIFLIQAVTCFAQPVLNYSDIGYQVGQSFQGHNGVWMDPGPAGANQTWDFTGFTELQSFTINFVSPGTTTNGSSFPGATAGLTLSAAAHVAYYQANATVQALMGISAFGVNIFYSDSEEHLRFPLNYGDQFTDDLYSELYSGADFTRDGSASVSVDGYGTVTLPDGTVVNDVLRIHVAEEYDDEIVGTSNPTTTSDLYFFYKAGTRYPIVNIASVINPQQSGEYMEYIDYTPQGIADRYDLTLRTYPNPAADRVYLNSDENFEMITIMSNSGAKVLSLGTDGKTGIDVSGLVPGIYFLEAINRDNETFRSKFVKK